MMGFVPSGEFIMGGTGDRDGGPEHVQIEAKSFWVGKYPITNAQFAQFVHADGYKRRGFWVTAIEANRWENGQFRGRDGEWREGHREYGEQFSGMNHPVTGVSWYEALAFTEWLRARLGIVTFVSSAHAAAQHQLSECALATLAIDFTFMQTTGSAHVERAAGRIQRLG